MKKMLILVSMLYCIGCIQNTANNSSVEQKGLNKVDSAKLIVNDTVYPKPILENGLEKEYDDAKWNLYLYAINDTPKDDEGNLVFPNNKTYGSLPLIFDTLYQSNDSLIYFFDFYVNDSLLTEKRISKLRLKDVPCAVRADSVSRCVYYKGVLGFDPTSLCMDLNTIPQPKELKKNDKSLFLNSIGKLSYPLNPFIVEYINVHQSELNAWFVKEAKKRGVIKHNVPK